jgi:hypothetical protein
LGLPTTDGLLDLTAWRAEYTQQQWSVVLESGIAEAAFCRRLQEASRRGRPFGVTNSLVDWSHARDASCGLSLSVGQGSSGQERMSSFRWKLVFECNVPSFPTRARGVSDDDKREEIV